MATLEILAWEGCDFSDPSNYGDPMTDPVVRTYFLNFLDVATPLATWVQNAINFWLSMPPGRRGARAFGFMYPEFEYHVYRYGALSDRLGFEVGLGNIPQTILPAFGRYPSRAVCSLQTRLEALRDAMISAGIILDHFELDTEIYFTDELSLADIEYIYTNYANLFQYTFADFTAEGGIENPIRNAAHREFREVVERRVSNEIRKMMEIMQPVIRGGRIPEWEAYPYGIRRKTLRGGPTKFVLSNGLNIRQLHHYPILDNGQALHGGAMVGVITAPVAYLQPQSVWIPGSGHKNRIGQIALILNNLELTKMESPANFYMWPWVSAFNYLGDQMFGYNYWLWAHICARKYNLTDEPSGPPTLNFTFWNSTAPTAEASNLARNMARQAIAMIKQAGLAEEDSSMIRVRRPLLRVGVDEEIVSPGIVTRPSDTPPVYVANP